MQQIIPIVRRLQVIILAHVNIDLTLFKCGMCPYGKDGMDRPQDINTASAHQLRMF